MGVEYFDYQLRGRSFTLVTDHKAIIYLKDKYDFGNNRIARWIDKLQEYDFEIIYKKGEELASADAMSRLYELEASSDDERIKIIQEVHENLLHRGVVPVEHKLKKNYNWPDMKALITKVISKCEQCSKNNRKLGGGSKFITTKEPLEIAAIDIMKISEENMNLLIFIDYYSRIVKIRILKDRTTENILKELNEIIKEVGIPKEICSDNAKEFCSKEFFNFCTDLNIKHHLCSVEKHKSNGRVERVIRTLRDYLSKLKEQKSLREKVKNIEQCYNSTYHSGIRCTPIEALMRKSEEVKLLNDKDGPYAQTFKERKREKFVAGQEVRIANKENLNTVGKSYDRL